MREVAVPVTMTSLVNASMFAILNLSDVPVIYEISRVACFCIIALYVSVLFCFPAYCYLDLNRQESGRMDCLICFKRSNPTEEGKKQDFRNTFLYDKFYKPLVLGSDKKVRSVVHVTVVVLSCAVFAVAAWGITERDIGIGLEDFFPHNNPAGRWAAVSNDELAAWAIGVNWGAINYTDPDTQMKMIRQYERVVATTHVTERDTKQLWMANFAVWSSRHCEDNFDREKFDELKCGRDQTFEDGSHCTGSWFLNKYGLREKNIQNITDDSCMVFEGGICRPREHMHPDDLKELNEDFKDETAFCPVIHGWSDRKWQFCLQRWRNVTGASQRFVLEEEQGSPTDCGGVYHQDENITWPIPFSDGPGLFAVDLFSHQLTLDMMAETRAVCDDDEELHCWMSGVPFDYWTQFDGIFEVLWELAISSIAAGFGIAFLFLFMKLLFEGHHTTGRILIGSLVGACLIGITMILSLVTVTGLSILAGVNLTGFSNTAFILSVGFSVEYSVHIVSRWMRANMSHPTSLDRVHHTMSFLMLPTFMSFASSTIGVACLAFTDFDFNRVYFFRPLTIVMFASYWYGCWLLPVVLSHIDWEVVKLGKPRAVETVKTVKTGEFDLDGENGDSESVDVPLVGPTRQEAFIPIQRPNEWSDICHRAPDPPTGPVVFVREDSSGTTSLS